MRKHNRKFAQRWARLPGDRTNNPQMRAHKLAHDKLFQFWNCSLLMGLLARV